MCLTTEEFKVKTATKDIIVYKVVQFHYNEYCSPFRGFLITLNEVFKEPKFMEEASEIEVSPFGGTKYNLEKGFHSFYNLKDCALLKNAILGGEYKFAQCIIPKGSLYIDGKFEFHTSPNSESIELVSLNSVMSNQIVYKQFIEPGLKGRIKMWWKIIINKLKIK